MEQKVQTIGEKTCRIHWTELPEVIMIQPIGYQHASRVDEEIAWIRQRSNKPFVLAAFEIADWEKELLPWADPMVSKVQGVGEHAYDTLTYIEQELLPVLYAHFGVLPSILGGYSLGGLFALWASMQTERFVGIAAASPSVWVKGWLEYVCAHPTRAQRIYMSLGNKEANSKNKAIAEVNNCISEYHKQLLMLLGVEHTVLEWNEGSHFCNIAARTARGFLWNLAV